jgi:hypothetical protein
MNLPQFPGWHLIGAFPDHEPGDVGSWLLVHDGEAMLLEVPEGLTIADVKAAMNRLGLSTLKYVTASHEHWDHLDTEVWAALQEAFSEAKFLHPSTLRGDRLLHLGGEPAWLLKAPKHSFGDVVTVFRGVAMTGDIELGMLESVNDEVPKYVKRRSMKRLAGFPARAGYHVHTTVSAHLNDVRMGVDWNQCFNLEARDGR